MRTLVILLIFAIGFPLWADDVMHATSEDIAEFDNLLGDAPIEMPEPKAKPPKGKKPKGDKAVPPKGGQDGKAPPPREQFNKGNRPDARGMAPKPRERKGPPRDDRERGRRNPPPPPGSGPPPPGGGNPPPPPPGP